jgi:hypothetical protein
MFIRIMLTSLIVATIATTAVQAAPPKLDVSEYKAYDRFDHIVHPDEEVGPEIDDDNPLKDPIYHEIFDIDKILNGPNPAEIVDVQVVVR